MPPHSAAPCFPPNAVDRQLANRLDSWHILGRGCARWGLGFARRFRRRREKRLIIREQSTLIAIGTPLPGTSLRREGRWGEGLQKCSYKRKRRRPVLGRPVWFV